MLRLYTYYRSSAAYRVRIALNLKGLQAEAIPVHLLNDGGQQHTPAYRALSPLGNVPTLELSDEADAATGVGGKAVLTQSLAIIEYLDETWPLPALLPGTPLARARVRALALSIACDIHPLNNLRVLNYLRDEFGVSEDGSRNWYRHWVEQGLAGVETLLTQNPDTGLCCHGDSPTLADCCLVPQVYNARRFHCHLEAMPTIRRIVGHCESLAAFQNAAPDAQPDSQ